MKINLKNRAKAEKLIYDTMATLDPSKVCANNYKKQLSEMSDKEFSDFFIDLFSGDEYLILDFVDHERKLELANIQKCAKDVLHIPLEERVALPHMSIDPNNPILTKYPVPVGYLHIKRVQQTQRKKNSGSTNIEMRSALTGQVMGRDRNGTESDQENIALVTLEANNSLREFNGPRADDMVMKNEMYASIAKNGYVSLDDLTDDVQNKTTLNTVDVYMTCMGFKTDLVTKGLVLKKTVK